MSFIALFVSLPTKASTGRMRVWRSVKALGCATLRDGVYLLPDSADSAAALDEVAAQAVEVGGSGEVYRLSGCEEAQEGALRALFDRGEEYAGIAEEIKELGRSLASLDGAAAADAFQVGLGVLVAHLAQHAVVQGQLGMGAGADAEVVAEVPVVQVVLALLAGLREGRGFVVGVTGGSQPGLDGFLHVGADVALR